MLNDINFLNEYKGRKRTELLKNGIMNSVRYYRSVGYFRSSVYALFNREFRSFFEKGGLAKIICGYEISDEDWQTMVKNFNDGKEISEKLNDRLVEETEQMYLDNPKSISFFAHLIQTKKVEIRIAFKKNNKGIYHEKHGVFIDSDNNYVSFSGSANETGPGWLENYESVDTWTSWEETKKIDALKKRENFESFWTEMENDEVKLFNIPEAYEKKIKLKIPPYSTEGSGEEMPPIEGGNPLPDPPPVKELINVKIDKLRDHQERAAQAWKSNNELGLLQHCTGSGKTVTAIYLIREHILRGGNVIICVPTKLLISQWEKELKTELINIEPQIIVCSSLKTRWKKIRLSLYLEDLDDNRNGNIILTTYETFLSPITSSLPKKIDKLLFIADEAHHLGSKENSKIMQLKFGKRLGLTATPERTDSEETTKIVNFFDKVVDKFTIAEAIKLNLLTKYYYYVGFPNLTEIENDEWKEISKKIKKIYAILKGQKDKDPHMKKQLENLILNRSRIVKSSQCKVTFASEVINKNFKDEEHWLIFCSDKKQIEDLKNQFYKQEKLKNKIFTVHYDQETGENDSNLDYYINNGGILLSVNMLNAGVDIPIISHAIILASSKSPIEFIQRRGRVLRLHKNKPYAFIYDPLVLPLNASDLEDKKTLGIGMVERSLEFSSTCVNKDIELDIRKELLDRGLLKLFEN